jgi:hypothetical protein
MQNCTACNTPNLDESNYCDACGVLLVTTTHGWLSDQSQVEGNGNRVSGPVRGSFEVGGASQAGPRSSKLSALGPLPDRIHAQLVIERGLSAGRQFPLSDAESQIGRWDADGGIFPDVDLDAVDPEAKVSRRHARILMSGGQYFIEDLGSTNGTFVNRGRRLAPQCRHQLRDGDEIIVGKTFLRFHIVK